MSALVGIVAGLGSGLLTALVYGFEDLFQKVPIHWMWWPAIGGLVVGVGGLIDPRVLGVGYDVIRGLLRGDLIGTVALTLLIVKAVAWSFSLGSGTSGGVLAPLLIMGGALGAFEARWIPLGDAGLWAMISMAAMMGGTMRSPFTAMIFTLELTHDLNMLPGLLVASVVADGVTVLLLRRSILTEKVARRGHHLVREYSVDPLEVLRVEEVMDENVPTIPATVTVRELSERIGHGDPLLTRRQATLIVDQQGRLVGIITRRDIFRALGQNEDGEIPVLEAGRRDLVVTHPDELLSDAVAKMLKRNIGRLPVVSRDDPQKLIGYIGRTNLMEARLRKIEEEDVRERSWALPRSGSRASGD